MGSGPSKKEIIADWTKECTNTGPGKNNSTKRQLCKKGSEAKYKEKEKYDAPSIKKQIRNKDKKDKKKKTYKIKILVNLFMF